MQTPTPWSVRKDEFEIEHATCIDGPSGRCGVVCCGHDYDDGGLLSADDAELIVRAVNAHAELVEACKAALEKEDNAFEPDNQSKLYQRLKAALQKAQG